MSNLWSKYKKEREGIITLEKEFGFVSYRMFSDSNNIRYCYITDIYVDHDQRKSGLALEMAKEVEKIAKDDKCDFMLGSIDTKLSKEQTRQSEYALLGFGMFMEPQSQLVFYKKEI